MPTESKLDHRYDFVVLYDCEMGNPNGDPDAGNQPRLDPETGHGIVTDVCIKRKIRNYVELTRPGSAGYEIYIKEKAVLNRQNARAYEALGVKAGEATEGAEVADTKATKKKGRKGSADDVEKAREWMCKNFFDVRTFGAVMSIEINCGQVRGPVQLTFGRSIDPVLPLEHSITRMAVATEREAEAQSGDNRTMGRKNTIPYGLYRTHGFVSAALAEQTGFGAEDLALLWEAIRNMFEHDRSAARGLMTTRKLFVFEHEGKLGNAPAHDLFDLVKIQKKDGVGNPRQYSDYIVEEPKNLPRGVRLA
ncbi:MAG: type I-C CRISPR-associated protein Cas7/Csd2 [Thermoanaerobaculia bacterium]